MDGKQELDTLKDIKNIMERSSRFIGLSGGSGISAGLFALIGAYFANEAISSDSGIKTYELILIGFATFMCAGISAFAFTYNRSRKTGVPIWGHAARKLMINIAIPMVAGGCLILKMIDMGQIILVAPACLIVYGIALFCGSGQTIKEIRDLAYCEMLLGIISLFFLGNGILFWSIGFGGLHILYGILMWIKYEKGVKSESK